MGIQLRAVNDDKSVALFWDGDPKDEEFDLTYEDWLILNDLPPRDRYRFLLSTKTDREDA